ncbi:hypothetical protein [Roseicyclus persicicus]|uniref:Uncharacterized protein n=1 Tax=Roseicyclus persicicus TaxID=2650661 RepID=A0A7X6GXD9_9RHOB|nr:hypothetical protein [Roseibacterium persicicum]NKX44073.1 hypothetical protein [Roseibacterium persicicum]
MTRLPRPIPASEAPARTRRLWRAVHAAGALGLAALAAALFAGLPARAQETGELGFDATLPSIDACLQAHFDPDRYAADLAAEGWLPLPEADRAAAVAAIADASAPLWDSDFDWSAADAGAQRAAAQAEIAAYAEGRRLFTHPDGALLLLAGDSADDGARRIRCMRATSGTTMDAGIDIIATMFGAETPVPEQAPGIRTTVLSPIPYEPGIDLSFYIASAAPDPAPEPPLGANEVFIIELMFSPDAPSQ